MKKLITTLSLSLGLSLLPLSVRGSTVEEAVAAYQAENYEKAEQLWFEIAIAKQGEREEAAAYTNLAAIYHKLNAWEKAEKYINLSLELSPKWPELLAQAQLIYGNIKLDTNNAKQAVASYQKAASIYQQLKNQEAYIQTQLNTIKGLEKLGFYRQIAINLKQLTPQIKNLPESPTKIRFLLNLGEAYQLNNDYQKAEALTLEAQELATKLNLNPNQIILTLAKLAQKQGNYELAKNGYQKIINTRRNTSSIENFTAQFNLVKLNYLEGKDVTPSAQALIAEPLPNTGNILNQKLELAEILVKSKTNSKNIIQKLKQQATELKDNYSLSTIYFLESSLALEQKQYHKAESLITKAIQTNPDFNPDYQHFALLGNIYEQQNQTQKAITAYNQAITIINQIKGDLVSNPDFQFQFTKEVEPLHRNLVKLLVANPTQNNLAQARDIIESLQLVELENYFRASCLDAKKQTIDNIDINASAIYPILLEDRVGAIASLPGNQLLYHETQIAKSQQDLMLSELRGSYNLNSFEIERKILSNQVYNWLVAPFVSKFQKKAIKTLVFVPDSEIRNIPLAALQNAEGKYLIEDYAVTVAPGLQLLPNQTKKISQSTIIGALSDASQGFKPLPAVETEANIIASTLNSNILLNKSFTSKTLENQIRSQNSSIIHLATHGQFSSQPENTFILTYDDKINTEKLRSLIQIRDENPYIDQIDLLVLSACETAVGDNRAALGLAGVAVRSGARSTLASLWQVNDESTSNLMQIFYSNLASKPNLNKAEILRLSQLELLNSKTFSHPYYWASFTLVGNWL